MQPQRGHGWVMSAPVLRVEDLHVQFPTDDGVVHAVNGVDFHIAPKETLAIVGESGSGKSVTALAIMRLVAGRVAGRILLEDCDLGGLSREDMRRVRGAAISMVFQEPMVSLNPVLRVGYQVAEAIRLHQNLAMPTAKARAVEMLARVGIPDAARIAESYPHQLSGGMRQRAMIAMALSCNPKLLIADEPTTALDVTIQAQVLDLMLRLKEEFETAILLITHDLGVVAETAERVIVMYGGRIVEEAPVHRLFQSPKHPYTAGLIRAVPRVDRPGPPERQFPAIPGVVPRLFAPPRGCSFRDRCPSAEPRCATETPPMVDLGQHQVRCWLYAEQH
jgi:peptide/nickel transport system ATP-binding protein